MLENDLRSHENVLQQKEFQKSCKRAPEYDYFMEKCKTGKLF